MKPISPKPIFTLFFFTTPNPKTIKKFSFFSTLTHNHHHHHQNPTSNYSSRRHEEESRSVRVSVWWDFENCNLPNNSNVFRVAQCVTNAVRANGIKGPIQITAFGDVMQISRTNQEALSATGINLTHVPSGGKNSADRSLLVDLMHWVSQNPPPAHLFLISGDRDFAGILHRLRMSNYNILLASPDSAPSVLCSAATIMWQWSSLLKGENLAGKIFNHPPDGPYGSWYGHYKAPIADPYAVNEQLSCFPANGSSELAPDSSLRPIPKAVMKNIRQILHMCPEGISITQLRAELSRSSVVIDKDLYGYRKFSRFLLAMPHVIKLHLGNDGQYIARGVSSRTVDDSVPTLFVEPRNNHEEYSVPKSSDGSSSEDVTETLAVPLVPEAKTRGEAASLLEAQKEGKRNESTPLMNTQEIKVKANTTKLKPQVAKLQGAQKEERKNGSSSSTCIQEIKNKASETNLQEPIKKEKWKASLPQSSKQDKNVEFQEPTKKEVASPLVKTIDSSDPSMEHGAVAEFGIFRRIWMRLFGSGDSNYSDKNSHNVDEILSGGNKINEENLISNGSAESMCPAWFSPSSHEALIDGKFARYSYIVTDLSSQNSSLQSSLESNNKVGINHEKADQIKSSSKEPEFFSKESFWNELKSFIDTSKGSTLISQSRTRGHLAQNLGKHGPITLRFLGEHDLLHMVDLLICEKKWLEERDSKIFPFKLTLPSGKHPRINTPPSSNGLRHIFSGVQPNLQELGERKHENPPFTGVPLPEAQRGSSSKPRREIISDCQKLVDQIFKDYPEGFNIGSFRKLFLERHGYALDIRKLGYDKLVNLLLIMPGVRIESNLIVPAGPSKSSGVQTIDLLSQESTVGPTADSQSESSDLSGKDDESDCSWDELGPINNSGSKKEETISRKSRTGRKKEMDLDYEPLDEDEITDSEEETSAEELKSKMSNEDSSLLQILDSWCESKEGYSGNDEKTEINNAKDSSKGDTPPSTLSDVRTKNASTVANLMRKQKLTKNYSFVTEQPVDSKDKLVDGILCSLKKSGDKSADSRVLG